MKIVHAIAGAIVGFGLLIQVGGCASSSEFDDSVLINPVIHTQPQLRDDLLDLFQRDQRARRDMIRSINDAPPPAPGERYAAEAMPAVEAVVAIDQEAAVFLEQTLDQYGWPTVTMVGWDGSDAVWLLAQHADQHPDLQRRALSLMEQAVEQGEAKPDKLAYLTDRVLVKMQTPQRYGTQFGVDGEGVHRPYPIEDGAETVNERRARVRLPPMSYAAQEWGAALGVRASAEPLESWPE